METLGIVFASGIVILLADILRCLFMNKRRNVNFFRAAAYLLIAFVSVSLVLFHAEIFKSEQAWSCSVFLSLGAPYVIDRLLAYGIFALGQCAGLKTSSIIL